MSLDKHKIKIKLVVLYKITIQSHKKRAIAYIFQIVEVMSWTQKLVVQTA